MKKIFSLVIMALVITYSLSSCKKKVVGQEVSVSIQSPADGTIFTSGDTIHLKVFAQDNEDLHEMKLEIKQGANILLGLYPYVHALQNYTIDTMIIAPVVIGSNMYTMEAEAADHDSHTATDIRSITINP